MEFNKPVSNPLLMGSIELMKAEDTPAHRNMFMGELAKAEFLSPAIIEPAPQEADGKLAIAPGSKVQFPMINSPDGAKFFKELPTFAMKIEEFAAMILRRDPKGGLCPALGMVINPMGANILVPREMLAGMMSARAAQMQRMAEKQKK